MEIFINKQAGHKISDHSEKINRLIEENERLGQTNEKKVWIITM
jgi:hypothetical protein